ncbi:DUF4870 domain-containing protein [Solibacillus sp. CAU 1738]|uniref:DUF4870 domain-containing protein n=1 Tax=Solibacillus sp. CAU 1738 TaxID=3140363 RepID=UPI003261694A
MDNNKVLSALNYFSVFFAPFIVPVIIWIVVQDEEVKRHAKRALLSHIIPVILGFFFVIYFIFGLSFGGYQGDDNLIFFSIGGMLLYGLIYLALIIWNIVQGIKVMR